MTFLAIFLRINFDMANAFTREREREIERGGKSLGLRIHDDSTHMRLFLDVFVSGRVLYG